MSTPQEKAKELVDKFARIDGYVDSIDLSKCEFEKKCALIAVDEIVESRNDDRRFNDVLSSISSEYYTPHPMYLTYWLQVKQEIENL